ncbi:MAG: hypothetical protein EXQ55_01140 [Acidobacteria bacterium]|nr:hypothetical protein [Acidobacteriota bacterium]
MPTNERPYWAKPPLVAQLKFGEWTDDGVLRQPVYLGMRDDVAPKSVTREPAPTLHAESLRGQGREQRAKGREQRAKSSANGLDNVIEQLNTIEDGPGSGALQLPDGSTLDVSNLRKVFWPELKITKGELMRYYVRVSPFILPVVKDRPLIMKRFPNGVAGKAFYQQRAPDAVPPGVRVAALPDDTDVPSRIIGGNLTTLLYMTQLAAISQDPWFSRVPSPHAADQCAIDLDPMPGVTFARVLDVARWVRDELDTLNVQGFPKTSGATGIHAFVPLRDGTPHEAGQIFCQILATVIAGKHPNVATVTRAVRARGPKVYVNYLQNIEGKSLACACSARASAFAGAATPLTWTEIDEGVNPQDFTILTLPDRLAEVGDLWQPLLASKGVDLRKLSTALSALTGS